MSRLLYSLLYYTLTPLLFMRLLIKHRNSRQYKNERQSLRPAERLGFFPKPQLKGHSEPFWLHTVSVGEFIATLPLIKHLLQEYPDDSMVITCTTTTGSAQIIKTFAVEIEQGKVFHVYLPYDLPGSMRRFLKKIKPCLAIIMETEIWPNLLTVTQQANIPIWLLNARMSARSAKGYARFPTLTSQTLQKFTGIAAQDVLDAGRLQALGAKPEHIHVTGSIKFDLNITPQDINTGNSFREQLHWQNKKVLIAASTHKGEDEIILSVFQQLKPRFPELVMIVVPRHPERFQSVFQNLKESQFNVIKRSQMAGTYSDKQNSQQAVDILLGDSMGEMMSYFACADLVYMGGTLVPTGGHNILEPAALGLPIVYGPHIFNFYAINELFLQYQAAIQVTNSTELEQILAKLLADTGAAKAMGAKAKQIMTQNSGALGKMLELLRPYLNLEKSVKSTTP